MYSSYFVIKKENVIFFAHQVICIKKITKMHIFISLRPML